MQSIYPKHPLRSSETGATPVSKKDEPSKWESLFRTVDSKVEIGGVCPEPQRALIAELKAQALKNEGEETELLINLAGGLSGPQLAREAARAVVDICIDMETPAHLREAIMDQCVALYDLVASRPAPPNDSKSAPSAADHAASGPRRQEEWLPEAIRPEVLYLAAERIRMGGGTPRANHAKTFDLAMSRAAETAEPDVESGEGRGMKMLAPGRYVTNFELLAARDTLGTLDVYDNTVALSNSVAITEVVSSVAVDGQPRALLVDTGKHWVAMLACKDSQGEVRGLVFDSKPDERPLTPDGLRERREVQLPRIFKEMNGAGLQYVARPFQDKGQQNPRSLDAACGPFAMLALRAANAHLANRKPTDFESMKNAIEAWTAAWSRLDDATQESIICAQRASLLGALR